MYCSPEEDMPERNTKANTSFRGLCFYARLHALSMTTTERETSTVKLVFRRFLWYQRW